MDADGFGDDEDFGMMNAPVAQAMLGSVDKNAQNELLAQLSGEDSSAGSLPVPIEFRTRDLVRSTFRTALVPAGGAPELRVEALGRPARRAWVLLAALAAMAGALLLVRGTAGTLVPVGVLAVGLVAGFALNASFGGGGEPVWVGVVLGGLLGLRRPPTATMEEDSA